MSNEVYVGAYLLVPTIDHKEVTEREQCSGCVDHALSWGCKFCPLCGSQIETIKQEHWIKKALSCHNLGKEFEEEFFTPGSSRSGPSHSKAYTLWLPNQKLDGAFHNMGESCTDVDSLVGVSMRLDYPQSQVDAFLKKFSSTIFALKDKFNVDALLQVGVVSYSFYD